MPFSLQKDASEGYYEEDTSNEVEDFEESFTVHRESLSQEHKLWRFVLNLPDMPFWLNLWEEPWSATTELKFLQTILKREELVEKLCALIAKPLHTREALELLTLHAVLASFDYIPAALQTTVEESLQAYQAVVTAPSQAQSFVLDALVKRLHGTDEMIELPDTRAEILRNLAKQSHLNRAHVELILQASVDMRKYIVRLDRPPGRNTVYEMAWDLVQQSFALDAEAQQAVLRGLSSEKAMICASAALLLQKCKSLPPDVRAAATEKILAILADPALARRTLDTPDGYDWQLDDILFETLQSLAGREG